MCDHLEFGVILNLFIVYVYVCVELFVPNGDLIVVYTLYREL